jgi:hypothetical protein
MTLSDTFRAADHVLTTLQLDNLWALQEGIGNSAEIQDRLRRIDYVHQEVERLTKAAAIHSSGFSRYAASGGAANAPSEN